MRLNSLAQVGGVNSLGNFARSWQRAAGFNEPPERRPVFIIGRDDDEERAGGRNSDPRLPEHRSLLRQQIERQGLPSESAIDDVEDRNHHSNQISVSASSARNTEVLDHAPYLASPYASSYGGVYGSLSSRVNDSSLKHAGRLFEEQQVAGIGEPDKEQEPLLIRRVEQGDGKIVEEIVGRSTLPQTLLNSVNVLVGVGILSLPLAFRYSGWLFGLAFLLFAAITTNYTAGLLAKCLNLDPCMSHFAELASAAFGVKIRIIAEILINLELTAAIVALIVLFADSLNALLPALSITEWKVVGTVIILPLGFVPMRYLSITSILGVLCSFGSRLWRPTV